MNLYESRIPMGIGDVQVRLPAVPIPQMSKRGNHSSRGRMEERVEHLLSTAFPMWERL